MPILAVLAEPARTVAFPSHPSVGTGPVLEALPTDLWEVSPGCIPCSLVQTGLWTGTQRSPYCYPKAAASFPLDANLYPTDFCCVPSVMAWSHPWWFHRDLTLPVWIIPRPSFCLPASHASCSNHTPVPIRHVQQESSLC